jgi:protein TonB
MTHQPQPSRQDLLDIVFENRNQSYGAYALRRAYPTNLARALGAGTLLIATFAFSVYVASNIGKNATSLQVSGDPIICFTSNDFKPKPLLKLPKAAGALPPKALQRFVAPMVIADAQAPELDHTATQEALVQSDLTVGVSNQSGVSDGPPSLHNLDLVGMGGGETNTSSTGSETVFDGADVQKMPSFPGGDQELLRYLSKHIQYPAAARMAGIQSQVVVSFTVNTDGSISDLVVLKDPGGGCGKEVIRVVSSMPYWIPGEANGHHVRVRFFLPVRFELR